MIQAQNIWSQKQNGCDLANPSVGMQPGPGGSPQMACMASPIDAGSPPQDAGNPPPVDAGNPPPQDAGNPPPVDAGNPPPFDAGNPPPDDAGNPPPDDAGNPLPVDAGNGVDAGTKSDAGRPHGGTDASAGPVDDAGDNGDNGGPTGDNSGCTVSSAHDTNHGVAAAFGALLALAALGRARRRS
jgi:MYXO-CTERM domain-containing protein